MPCLPLHPCSDAFAPSYLEDEDTFTAMLQWMEATYPTLWAALHVERVRLPARLHYMRVLRTSLCEVA